MHIRRNLSAYLPGQLRTATTTSGAGTLEMCCIPRRTIEQIPAASQSQVLDHRESRTDSSQTSLSAAKVRSMGTQLKTLKKKCQKFLVETERDKLQTDVKGLKRGIKEGLKLFHPNYAQCSAVWRKDQLRESPGALLLIPVWIIWNEIGQTSSYRLKSFRHCRRGPWYPSWHYVRIICGYIGHAFNYPPRASTKQGVRSQDSVRRPST